MLSGELLLGNLFIILVIVAGTIENLSSYTDLSKLYPEVKRRADNYSVKTRGY
jgi:hypothetical protein